jgi:hypothetical protein
MKRTPIAALSAALLIAAPVAMANNQHDSVSAHVKHGTLEVKGHGQANNIALRLAPNNPSVIQVDAGNDQTADFSVARAAIDAIDVRAGNGDDVVTIDDANGSFTDTIPTTIAGGDGNDRLNGGLGAENFRGGDGNDVVHGGKGADTADLGAGDDNFVWDPGDGNDVIEGQEGTDAMVFNGAGADERVTVSAKDHRAIFFRQPGAVTMDMRGVEVLDFNALGGNDNVAVGDLSGTDVTQTNIDLAAPAGTLSDVDNVTVDATAGDDNVAVTGNGSGADVTGLPASVSVTHANPTDLLAVNTLAGNDHVAVSGVTGLIGLLVDGVPSS